MSHILIAPFSTYSIKASERACLILLAVSEWNLSLFERNGESGRGLVKKRPFQYQIEAREKDDSHNDEVWSEHSFNVYLFSLFLFTPSVLISRARLYLFTGLREMKVAHDKSSGWGLHFESRRNPKRASSAKWLSFCFFLRRMVRSWTKRCANWPQAYEETMKERFAQIVRRSAGFYRHCFWIELLWADSWLKNIFVAKERCTSSEYAQTYTGIKGICFDGQSSALDFLAESDWCCQNVVEVGYSLSGQRVIYLICLMSAG